MVNLINDKYATYYHSSKMSTTFAFCCLLYFLMILTPFLLGFATQNFWLRQSYYFEQPTINSLDQYILLVKTTDSSYFYTNIPDIQRQRSNSEMLPQVQISSQSDSSLSSEMAKAQNFSIQINLQQKAKNIQFVQLTMVYQYQLTGNVKLIMQSFAEVSLQAQSGISHATVVGTIQLTQRHPLYSGDVYRTRYNYPPYYDQYGALLQDQMQMVEANVNRNETMQFEYNTFIRPALFDTGSQINILMQVPKNQEVQQKQINIISRYIATLFETLKFAWVQYFSFFLLFWWFGQQLLSFVIENGVFPTLQVNDLPIQSVQYSKKKHQ